MGTHGNTLRLAHAYPAKSISTCAAATAKSPHAEARSVAPNLPNVYHTLSPQQLEETAKLLAVSGRFLMHWLYLALSIVLEACGTTSMKLSDGFTKLTPSVLIFVFYGLAFTAFVFALKRIDVSVAYAMWAGLGVLLIAAVGMVYFKEPVTALKIASILLIMGGVAGLYSSGVSH